MQALKGLVRHDWNITVSNVLLESYLFQSEYYIEEVKKSRRTRRRRRRLEGVRGVREDCEMG